MLDNKDTLNLDRQSRLLSLGWEPLTRNFSLEETLHTLLYRQSSVENELKRLAGSFFAITDETHLSFPEKLVKASINSEFQRRVESIFDLFRENPVKAEKDRLNEPFAINGQVPVDRENLGHNQNMDPRDRLRLELHYFFWLRTLAVYGAGEKLFLMRHLPDRESYFQRLPSSGETVFSWRDFIKAPEEVISLHSTACFSLYRPKANQPCHFTAELDEDQAPAILQDAVGGYCCRMENHRINVGELRANYALESFHDQARSLTRDLTNYIDRAGKHYTKVLVHGPSRTEKSQWARSFAKEVLGPRGYFTFILPPNQIDPDLLSQYLPRICCIVDEFFAESRAGASDGERLRTNEFLRLFDDSVFEDVVPYEAPQAPQREVVWIFTSNHESDKDWDPAMKTRFDFIRNFTIKPDGTESQHRLDPIRNGKATMEKLS
ncbi:MAG: hypothetical protein ABEI32_09130 [Halothece sp.]